MTDRAALELTTSVTWLAHLIERFANLRLAGASLPLSMSYARANLLMAVHSAHAEQNSARMVDIALDLGVTGRTLTTMVDSLEKQDLIMRVIDPADRRAFQLLLTDQGNQLIPHLQSELLQAAEAVAAPLSESDRAQLTRLISRLIERGGA
jgi:DNA-binding MarR family transcriptional regulator